MLGYHLYNCINNVITIPVPSCDMDDFTGPLTTTVTSCDPEVELQLPDALAVLKGSNNKKPQQFLGGDQDRHTLLQQERCSVPKVYIL